MTELTIRLLGDFAVSDRDGNPVSVSGAKQRALLAYLALNAGKPIPRDRLMTLLWGERFDEQARQSLRQGLTKIRKLATDGKPLLHSDGDTISFDAAAIDVDALEFERLATDQTPTAYARAAELYGGELLDRQDVCRRVAETTGVATTDSSLWFTAATHRQWLSRMLNNLQAVFAHAGRERDLYAMQELQSLLM